MAQSKGIAGPVKLHAVLQWAKGNKVGAGIIALGIIAVFLFWEAFLFTAIALVFIFGVIFLAVKLRYKKPNIKQLFGEKKKLLDEIKIAEQHYMKRRMAEKEFTQFCKEKHKQLIEIEALIDQEYNKQKGVPVSDEMLAVQTKKRHILKELLEEKNRVFKEMNLAENSYLHRKIDVPTYQAIIQKKQQHAIELEAQIKQIYAEANVAKVMENLRQQLSQLDQKKKEQKKKHEMTEREKELEIAREIVEQIGREKNG